MSAGKQVVVIGGGLSGLSFVHYLKHFSKLMNKQQVIQSITLLEKSNRLGGSVYTKRFNDRTNHELGHPRIKMSGLRSKNTAVLLEQLNLNQDVIKDDDGPHKKNNARNVYHHKKFEPLPLAITKLLSKLPHCNKKLYNLLLSDFRTTKMDISRCQGNDPTVHEFVAYRFGKDIADNLADPILRSMIYGDSRQLSMEANMKDILDKEQATGHIVFSFKSAPQVKPVMDDYFKEEVMKSELALHLTTNKIYGFTLKNGLEDIAERLSDSVLETEHYGQYNIYTQTPATSVLFKTDEYGTRSVVAVNTIDGDRIELEADHVFACLPSNDLANLLPNDHPGFTAITNDLKRIEHTPVVRFCIDFKDIIQSLPKHARSQIIFINSKSGSKLLSLQMDSMIFPTLAPDNVFSISGGIGGPWFEEVFNTKDPNSVTSTQIEQVVRNDLLELLQIYNDPVRFSYNVIYEPQYKRSHLALLTNTKNDLESKLPITLLSRSYDGKSIHDTIYKSRQAAFNYIKSL